MNWFFEDPAAQARLLIARDRWKGTPYRKYSAVPGPGGGVDCIGYCEALLHESGALPRFNFPRRTRDYSPHVVNAKVLQNIRGQIADDPQSAFLAERLAELATDSEVMIGDLIVLKGGVELYHFVIAIDPPRCTQCWPEAGICECDLTAPKYKDAIVAIFRVKA